jgi:release factor glutamine methyltransferase
MASTIGDLLREGIARLKADGVSEPELSARLLLQHLLKLNQAQLSLKAKASTEPEIIYKYDELLSRRCQHVPVQYLIGEVEFYNIKLKVDPRVLIPRPETEELVEYLLNILIDRRRLTVLDIGVGSGNIAIALAVNLDDCLVTAVDISEDALELADINAILNKVETKIKFIHEDCLEPSFWESAGSFDVIVSNPPYVAADDYTDLQPEVRDHEPKVALVAEDDPLIFYKTICSQASSKLNQHGIVCFEVGYNQADDVAALIKSALPSASVSIINDITGIPRIVIGELP